MKSLALIALLVLAPLAGCTRPAALKSSATPTASGIIPDTTKPVRVSAEGVNAAEPAVAAGRDGAVYVAWVGHGAGKEADVWLSRVEAGAKGTGVEPARVNRTPGEATAWRGDAPSVAVST
jgi:hypothetical protein